MKKDMTTTLVNYCAGDLRSFENVTGNGFEMMNNKFIEIGVKYGSIEASKIIPDPTTISMHLLEEMQILLDSIKPILKEMFQNRQCAATTDMWTDDYKKNTLFSIHGSLYIR